VTVLYRSIWQAPEDDAIQVATEEFVSWLASKNITVDVPDEGDAAGSGVEIEARHGDNDSGTIARWVLREDRDGDRWLTTFTVICPEGEDESWFWVDVDNVSAEYLEAVTVPAPRLVRHLLDRMPGSHRGPQVLYSGALHLRADQLSEFYTELKDSDRELPVVVFGYDPKIGIDRSMERARTAAEILAGHCRVYSLGDLGEENFRNHVGDDLAVWRGAARVYLPGVNPDNPNPQRHKYFLPRTFAHSKRKPGMLVADYMARLISRQPPPKAFFGLRSLIDTRDFAAYEELFSEYEAIRREADGLKEELFDATAELDDVADRLQTARREQQRVWNAARSSGVDGELMEALTLTVEIEDSRFAEPGSCQEAIDLAGQHLGSLVVHTEAGQDLESIDQALESRSWTRSIWQGLVALNEYAVAAAEFNGNFWLWCSDSGHAWAWPATDKKLAMGESQDVKTNARYREQRVFPVDESVRPGGRILMLAHLKIAQGGGNHIPRVYFYDDTKGTTGKVHVGFIGPHNLVKNRSG